MAQSYEGCEGHGRKVRVSNGPTLRYGTKPSYILGYLAPDLDDRFDLTTCEIPLFSTPVEVPIAEVIVRAAEVIEYTEEEQRKLDEHKKKKRKGKEIEAVAPTPKCSMKTKSGSKGRSSSPIKAQRKKWVQRKIIDEEEDDDEEHPHEEFTQEKLVVDQPETEEVVTK